MPARWWESILIKQQLLLMKRHKNMKNEFLIKRDKAILINYGKSYQYTPRQRRTGEKKLRRGRKIDIKASLWEVEINDQGREKDSAGACTETIKASLDTTALPLLMKLIASFNTKVDEAKSLVDSLINAINAAIINPASIFLNAGTTNCACRLGRRGCKNKLCWMIIVASTRYFICWRFEWLLTCLPALKVPQQKLHRSRGIRNIFQSIIYRLFKWVATRKKYDCDKWMREGFRCA